MSINNAPLGQMTENERLYLNSIVKKLECKLVLESGTWYGGGSTLSITQGLYETGGVLHTFEEHYEFFNIAKKYYDSSMFTNNIKLYNLPFIDGLKNFSGDFFKSIDMILLDGGDELPNGQHKLDINEYQKDYNNSENVQSFKFLEDRIRIGCHILLHDWSVFGGRGTFVKNYLEKNNNNKFEIIKIMNDSTGLAHLKKIL